MAQADQVFNLPSGYNEYDPYLPGQESNPIQVEVRDRRERILQMLDEMGIRPYELDTALAATNMAPFYQQYQLANEQWQKMNPVKRGLMRMMGGSAEKKLLGSVKQKLQEPHDYYHSIAPGGTVDQSIESVISVLNDKTKVDQIKRTMREVWK